MSATARNGAVPVALALAVAVALALAGGVAPARAAEPEFDPAKELLRIAKMKQDDRILASFAESRGRSTPNLGEKELMTIVETVERVGTPDRAIRMLQDRSHRFPNDLESQVTLARMYVRASQTPRAAVVWKDVATRFGLTPAHALEYARILSASGDHAGALDALASIADKTPADSFDYWRALAQTAWGQDDSKTALLAYRKVWREDPPPPSASSRLMQLLADAGEIDEAITVAKQALVREQNPAHLLFVARLQIKRADLAGAKRTLDLADDQRALVASTLEYWMLRADVRSQLGDADGARDAHRVALRLDPSAPSVRAALLWDSIERNDLRRLALDLAAFTPTAARDREMWAPTAIGLDRVGRTRDAVPFFLLQSKETPNDDLWLLELSEALRRIGEENAAQNLRRRAYRGIRARALATAAANPSAPPPGANTPEPAATDKPLRERTTAAPSEPAYADQIAEAHVTLTRQLRGEPDAEKLVRRLLGPSDSFARAARGPSLAVEEFAIGWYLQQDNVDRARRHLARARIKRLQQASARKYALLIAMADDDRVAIEALLSDPAGLSEGERALAYLRVERDDRAVQPLRALIDRADVASVEVDPSGAPPPDADASTLRKELRALEERTAPTVTAAGRFSYINDLVIAGPSVGASYAHGESRFLVQASAHQLEDLEAAAVRLFARREAEMVAGVRTIGPRHVTEYRAGVDYQTDAPFEGPHPRLGYAGVFRLSRMATAAVDVTVQGRIEDTSFLRVAGLRDALTGDLVLEPIRKTYVLSTVAVYEDHTRSFDYLGFEVGGGLEGGYKILEKSPEWTVGLRVGAYGRDNRSDIPVDYRAIAKAGEGRSSLYSPSYQQIMFVMHLARGDFFERSRQDLAAFPRYDCEASAGLLTALGTARTPPAAAGALRCAIALRVPTPAGSGYVSVAGEYIKGVSGLAQADNAVASLSFTHFLR